MSEQDLEHGSSLPLPDKTFLKYFILAGLSQIVAIIAFIFVAQASVVTSYLATILEMSSLTILVGLFLEKGVVSALAIACLLIVFVSFALIGVVTHKSWLSLFSALSGISLGLMLYSPFITGVVFSSAYERPQVPLAVCLLFMIPIAIFLIGRLVHRN